MAVSHKYHYFSPRMPFNGGGMLVENSYSAPVSGLHFPFTEGEHLSPVTVEGSAADQGQEFMAAKVRDAAGDSGEFYTPRALLKFIVKVVDPRLGEMVLDPAAGTGGFLVEAFEHLKKQAKKTEDFTRLQAGTLT